MVRCDPNVILYAYEWKLEAQGVANDLICTAHENSTLANNYMHDQSLHCTSYVNIGPDREYEKAWYVEIESEELRMKHMYWTEGWLL